MKNDRKITIFISYSHKDKRWLEVVKKYLAKLENFGIVIWDDTQIRLGANWKTEIHETIDRCDIVLILASSNYLTSAYASTAELSHIITNANNKRLECLLIPIDFSNYQSSRLNQFQSIINPRTPLKNYTSSELAIEMTNVSNTILELTNRLDKLTNEMESRVQNNNFIELPNSFHVFMCHNSEDKPSVTKIALDLKAKQIRPWLDVWNLQPGLPWQRELERQISNIASAAVFVGENGMGPWQELEIEAYLRKFVNRNCPVIPVILPDCVKPPSLPVFLDGMTWVDFRKSEPEPISQLVWGITGKKQ